MARALVIALLLSTLPGCMLASLPIFPASGMRAATPGAVEAPGAMKTAPAVRLP